MATVNLTIDGQKVQARAGQTVLEAATAAGIQIPTLCHHPALAPIGACRICLVEVSPRQPLYPSCTYQVSEGLAVETRSPRVEATRRFVLEMLFSERNHYCMFCERSGNCELQDLGYAYGLDHWLYPAYLEGFPLDASRDTFLLDHNRCILCRRCLRACAELAANHTLGLRHRGARTLINADLDLPLGESSCIECGTCLQVCPTGALVDKRSAYLDLGPHVQVERVKSACSQCSVGCGIEIITWGGQVVRVEGDWQAAPNGGVLCKKGRFEPLARGGKRITTPLVRRNGALEPAGWDEALALAAQYLGSAPGGELGLVASAQASNEALYLASRIFGGELGAGSIRLLQPSLPARLQPEGALEEIGASDLILVAGADPVAAQPVASFLVKRAVDKGARLVVVDGAPNGLAPFAHHSLGMHELDRAAELAARADRPAVLYGPGLSAAGGQRLAALDRAVFVPLEPGANSRAAAALGLDHGDPAPTARVVYALLGELPADGDGPSTDDLGLGAAGATLVVQASYESSLTHRAAVVLPAAIWCETSGTLTNLEGNVREMKPAVEPQGQALPDWQILSRLSSKLGGGPAASLEALSAMAAAEIEGRSAAHG